VPALKLPAIASYMRKLAAEGLSRIPLYPGATEALQALHRAGIRLALVSSNAEDNIRAVLGPAADVIDHYACGSSLWGKSQKFRAVLSALGVRPTGALAIGDEIRDIEAARKANLAVGTVTFGYNSRKALAGAKPDYLFDNYDELLRAVMLG
jgi:phosphoglycolate phosphatase